MLIALIAIVLVAYIFISLNEGNWVHWILDKFTSG
jgi:Flp pilus assembly pilin Flp